MQINDLNASLNNQVSALNGEIAVIPGNAEIANMDERIKKLVAEKERLGWFKGKEKKAIQAQIDQLVAEKNAIQNRMAAAKKELEAKIAAAKADVQKKIAPMQSRINYINHELTKERPSSQDSATTIEVDPKTQDVSTEQIMAEIQKGNEAFIDFLCEISEVLAVDYLDGEDLTSAVESIMRNDEQRTLVQEYLTKNH